jgi:hypothetical protein
MGELIGRLGHAYFFVAVGKLLALLILIPIYDRTITAYTRWRRNRNDEVTG